MLAIGAFALLFAGSLWLLRPKRVPAPSPGRSAPPVPDRAALLEPSGMAPLAREEYFRRLSTECCPCGCDLNLRDCLLSDQSCVVSPPAAVALRAELE